jgi:phosphoribosylanthranilate isomerase
MNSRQNNTSQNLSRIKVCGLTQPSQVYALDEMGIEFAGFNFYKPSSRYIYKYSSAAAIKNIHGKINKTGVFVDEDVEKLLRTVDDCGLYLVQLHGNESPRYCEKVASYISVIKVFRLTGNENVEWKIKDYYDVADMFLFDTDSVSFGGSGKKFDWQVLKGLNIRKPFFLAGGIAVDDADELKKFSQNAVAKDLFAIDINSKFEVAPGVKDLEMIRIFKERLKEE